MSLKAPTAPSSLGNRRLATPIPAGRSYRSSFLGAAIGLLSSANAVLTPAEVAAMYSRTYDVLSVRPSATNPSIYEMTVAISGVRAVILVDANRGRTLRADGGAREEATIGCLDPGVLFLELFLNQRLCLDDVNVAPDERPLPPGNEPPDAGNGPPPDAGNGPPANAGNEPAANAGNPHLEDYDTASDGDSDLREGDDRLEERGHRPGEGNVNRAANERRP